MKKSCKIIINKYKRKLMIVSTALLVLFGLYLISRPLIQFQSRSYSVDRFGFSFRYPAHFELFINADNGSAGEIFLLDKSDPRYESRRKDIEEYLWCDQLPEPVGVCREHQLSEIEMYISQNFTTDLSEFEDKLRQNECEKIGDVKNTLTYYCSNNRQGLFGQKGEEYYAILNPLSESWVVINIYPGYIDEIGKNREIVVGLLKSIRLE